MMMMMSPKEAFKFRVFFVSGDNCLLFLFDFDVKIKLEVIRFFSPLFHTAMLKTNARDDSVCSVSTAHQRRRIMKRREKKTTKRKQSTNRLSHYFKLLICIRFCLYEIKKNEIFTNSYENCAYPCQAYVCARLISAQPKVNNLLLP